MTFVLVLLFKYGYTQFIYGYMAFAGFSIFFALTGIIAALLIQRVHAHIDVFSFLFVLYNFAVVGVLSLFYLVVPITLKQGYLVVTGVVTAYIFTWIPAWTTWMVLIAMSLYDLAAVLSPVGPLKVRGGHHAFMRQRMNRVVETMQVSVVCNLPAAYIIYLCITRCWWSWHKSGTRTSLHWCMRAGQWYAITTAVLSHTSRYTQ